MVSGIKKVSNKYCSLSSLPCLVSIKTLYVLFPLILMSGCVSDTVHRKDFVSTYQENLVARGPQERGDTGELAPFSPSPDPRIPAIETIEKANGKKAISLSLDHAVLRALANSPEITVVSVDPSIAKENIAIAASEFDVTVFGELGYDDIDKPSNDISTADQSHSSLWKVGIKQRGVTGAEWNLSYGQVRSNDKSVSRKFVTAYEPAMIFELKQPLLRDAWPDVNLAGVNISKLNYRIALAAFRQKAEAVSSEVISLYWTLIRARRNVEIQQALLEKTEETLRKVTDRKNIDATVGDIKQVEAAAKTREANLFEAEREVADVQDRLVRLLSDHQITVIDDLEIIPVTAMDIDSAELDRSELLKLALKNNPEIRQAELETDVEEINVKVAKKQKMPRVDVVASAELHGLSDDRGDAHELIYDRDFNSFTVGLNFEYPLGNRERNAEFRRRKLEHARARSNLHNITDRVAILVKERARLAETAFKQILVQKEAVSAAEIHLQALEYYESIIKKLTPEFLLTKIQAQNTLANTKRATMKAIADYNIALTRLAQATGTVLDLRSISPAAQQLIISELKQ